jgi:hypothetical protein
MGIINLNELEKEISEDRREEFAKLLDQITTADEKKRFLWRDIYNNAQREMKAAYRLFDDAYNNADMNDDVTHAGLGPVLVKYLERASKANEQLLKLANMIEEELKSQEEADFSNFKFKK